MSRALLVLANATIRAKAVNWIAKAPEGTRVEFKAPKRSLEQSALMWVLLTKLADRGRWHSLKLSPDDWKDLISAGLKRELRTVPNLTGDGFVMLGARTSDMSVAEMSAMIELIGVVAAQLGVSLDDEPQANAA